ncbi:MAG: very short patch repair endonuclease [Bacteroidota bacterium]|nr:very short patch repair endonuclease [Bacteroidota bacterium]
MIPSIQRHNNMAAIHSDSTKPELTLRRALWGRGFRYRTNVRSLPGSPDIVLPRYRTAVFVNGCFWHGHRGCRSYTVPKTNTEFWVAKVARNQERDQVVWRMLEAKGWSVVIVWECELKKAHLDATVDRVCAEIRRNGERYREFQAARRKAREEYQQEQRARKERESQLRADLKKYVNI